MGDMTLPLLGLIWVGGLLALAFTTELQRERLLAVAWVILILPTLGWILYGVWKWI